MKRIYIDQEMEKIKKGAILYSNSSNNRKQAYLEYFLNGLITFMEVCAVSGEPILFLPSEDIK